MSLIGIELRKNKMSFFIEGFSIEGMSRLKATLCSEEKIQPLPKISPRKRKPLARVVVLCRCGICLRVITTDNIGIQRVLTNDMSKLEEIKKEVSANREKLVSSIEETLKFVQKMRQKYRFTVNREGLAEKLVGKV